MYKPNYLNKVVPSLGETIEVAEDIFWVRMPLPFKLDHINLWLLRDGDGWTIIDTGIDTSDVRRAWESIFLDRKIGKLSIKKVIVTHFHPDHIGLAGWLTKRFSVPLCATITEWAFAHMQFSSSPKTSRNNYLSFYKKAGFEENLLEIVESRLGRYSDSVSPIPQSVIRICDGDHLEINRNAWEIIVGAGHAPEHACLYSRDLGVLISGDQILPRISPNVSVWPLEPEANPLKLFLESLEKFRRIPEETIILPSHDWPFKGLSGRLDELYEHHQERLNVTLEICSRPVSALEIQRTLFKKKLDNHQLFFAVGEALAHAHYLLDKGLVFREKGEDGVYRFCS